MSNNRKGVINLDAPGQTLSIGHGNYVLTERIVAILEVGGLGMKRLRECASIENRLVDATAGRKTRALVVTDSNHVILSALAPQTLQERLSSPPSHLLSQLELREGEFVS